MGAQLILGLIALLQAAEAPPKQTVPVVPIKPNEVVRVQAPLPPCDARPYQRLVGRTISDLLTARVPPNTRIYRVDDPLTAPVQSGRLSVELNRSTRVRRVYCS